jgi:hypothetical protein
VDREFKAAAVAVAGGDDAMVKADRAPGDGESNAAAGRVGGALRKAVEGLEDGFDLFRRNPGPWSRMVKRYAGPKLGILPL